MLSPFWTAAMQGIVPCFIDSTGREAKIASDQAPSLWIL